MIYIVSIEINSPNTNREQVIQDVHSAGTCRHYWDMTFLVSSSRYIDYLVPICTANLDKSDRLIMGQILKPFTVRMSNEDLKWLNENMR
jgi:hypothetical protein